MKYLSIFLVCILFPFALEAQNKEIQGDTTTFYYRYSQSLLDNLGMDDLLKSNDDFAFRVQYYGQVIDIRKNGEQFQGTLVNYIFKGKKGWQKSKTIVEKINLSDSLTLKVYQLINSSKILTLSSDNKIEGWEQGHDGITYAIEYSNKDTYSFKKYWTPSVQYKLKEAIIFNEFLSDLYNILPIKQSYQEFKQQLPKNGCYSNGGMVQTCHISNNYWLGYTGSTKLPLGYHLWANLGYLADLKTGMAFSVNHQMDTHGNYDFTALIGKADLLFKGVKGKNDFATYTYRTRKHSDIKQGTTFHKHNVAYGVNLKSTTIALGVDFLKGEQSKTGASFFLKQYIGKPRFNIEGEAFVYHNQFDYKVGISRVFGLNFAFINAVSVGIYYENFASHSNIGWTLYIPLP